MVKSYLRYVPESSYGVLLTSAFQNGVKLLKKGLRLEGESDKTRYGASISGEKVLILDLKTGAIARALSVQTVGRVYSGEGIPSIVHYVTAICEHPKKPEVIAAGYSDGSVRVWDISLNSVIHTFHGHGKNITALKFCKSGNYLACGSFDTEVTLWDVFSGKGLYRYSGHLNEITDIEFVHRVKLWTREDSESGGDGAESRNKSKMESSSGFKVILEETPHLLITSSKDCTVKIWNIQSQICLQTLTKHKGEVYSILLNPLCNRLFTAGSSGEISVYRLTYHSTGLGRDSLLPNDHAVEACSLFKESKDKETNIAVYYGGIPRFQGGKSSKVIKLLSRWSYSSGKNPLELVDDFYGTIFAFTNLNSIESFSYFDSEKISQRIKKLNKKLNRDSKADSADSNIYAGSYETLSLGKKLLMPEEEMAGTRLIGIDFDSSNNTFMVGLGNNSLRYVALSDAFNSELESKSKPKENDQNSKMDDTESSDQVCACKVLRRIENEGHRGIPRAIDVSQDDKFIATFGDHFIKIWNMKGFGCVKTMIAENPVCGFIAPGGDYTISGTKQGSIQLHDIPNCKLIQSLDNSHENSVQSLALCPDNTSFVSVAQDKSLNVYSFGLEEGSDESENKVTIKLIKTLPLLEEGLAVKYTPDGKYLVVSLLDNTVLVLYSDTLKQFLSLYGHSLPVACLDISHDNTIVATGSADKTIKIWGLDFGNIQRSFHAHSECVTQVCFVRDTHYLVSTARDGALKLWDTDKGELITILHQKSTYGQVPIICLGLTFDGDRIICGFLDRTIRVWFRTDQQLFIEEEREKEQEEQLEREILHGNTHDYAENTASVSVMSRPTRKTFESLKSTEKLMEVIDIAYNHYIELLKFDMIVAESVKEGNLEESRNMAPPPSPLEIGELSVQEYILTSILRISPNLLSEVVWSLPLLYAEKLLVLIEPVLKSMYDHSIMTANQKSEIFIHNQSLSFYGLEPLTRTVLCLVQTHFIHWISSMNTVSPILGQSDSTIGHTNVWTKSSDLRNERMPRYNIRSVLSNLKTYIHHLLKCQMEIVSLNNGILKILEQDASSSSSIKPITFDEVTQQRKNKQNKKRRTS
ncbi:WD40 repeat-containing protein of plant origin [Cryptosporidium canis]|uniref:WD40 repeat-containing protein of plant origin n=1 Tax=Cryptosporidium canis TaxID=195482 RepID=A0ABQ8P8K3_9CRYT|nr:WD40 repeat-containing protein of plant origin [Cryptosporidium canis]KAJ1612455.1 WD40 repeat-containing protein of plant origin [Cryptosporidium canis]